MHTGALGVVDVRGLILRELSFQKWRVADSLHRRAQRKREEAFSGLRQRVPASSLHAIHYEFGPVPICSTPHFRFARALIEGAKSSKEKNEWRAYIAAQHGVSVKALDVWERKFRYLVRVSGKRRTLFLIKVREDTGALTILDGFHRAATMAARSRHATIECLIL